MAVVKVGVFCVLRVFTGVFGLEMLRDLNAATLVSWVAGITVLLSSLIALSQDNLKRRLAFSTIGQLSYIVLGISILTPLAATGSMIHILMHAYGKITLFFCAGAIYVAIHKKYVSELTGVGRAMPVTMTAFFIGSLSVIGIPLTGGFISKFYLVAGAAQADKIAILVIYLVSSLLNAFYFLPIVFNAFFPREGASKFEGSCRTEAPLACLIPICFTASVSILLFFFPQIFLRLTQLFMP